MNFPLRVYIFNNCFKLYLYEVNTDYWKTRNRTIKWIKLIFSKLKIFLMASHYVGLGVGFHSVLPARLCTHFQYLQIMIMRYSLRILEYNKRDVDTA